MRLTQPVTAVSKKAVQDQQGHITRTAEDSKEAPLITAGQSRLQKPDKKCNGLKHANMLKPTVHGDMKTHEVVTSRGGQSANLLFSKLVKRERESRLPCVSLQQGWELFSARDHWDVYNIYHALQQINYLKITQPWIQGLFRPTSLMFPVSVG